MITDGAIYRAPAGKRRERPHTPGIPAPEGGPVPARQVTGFTFAATWRTVTHDLFDPYRPERHYMRGPGPKWRAKQFAYAAGNN
jgi:hypothetical protein